jgi:hypothetical protein
VCAAIHATPRMPSKNPSESMQTLETIRGERERTIIRLKTLGIGKTPCNLPENS